MVKQKITLILLFLLFVTVLIQAQVTIGSTKQPATGALLMLDDGTTEINNSAVNAKKGLGMPRVVLTNLTPTNGTELSASIGGSGTWDVIDHTGLTVYNIQETKIRTKDKECNDIYIVTIPKGLFVWNGSKWNALMNNENESSLVFPPSPNYFKFTDNRDPADPQIYSAFHYKVANTSSPTTFDDVGVWMLENIRAKSFVRNKDRDNTDNTISIDFDSSSPSYAQEFYKPMWSYPNIKTETDGSKTDLYNTNPKLGLLYNWVALSNNKTITDDFGDSAVTVQGICPTGWHLPTAAEWASLLIHFLYYTDVYSSVSVPLASLGSLDNTNLKLNAKRMIGDTSSPIQIPNNIMTSACTYIDASALPAGTTVEDVKGLSKSKHLGGFDVLLTGYAVLGSARVYGYDGSFCPSNGLLDGGDIFEKMNFRAQKGRVLSLNDGNDPSLFLSVRCKKN